MGWRRPAAHTVKAFDPVEAAMAAIPRAGFLPLPMLVLLLVPTAALAQAASYIAAQALGIAFVSLNEGIDATRTASVLP